MSALAKHQPMTVDAMAEAMWRAVGADVKQAERLAKQVLAIQPGHARALCIRAIMAWGRGDPAHVDLARRAVAADPADIEIQRVAARQLSEAGDLDEAIGHYEAVNSIQDTLQTRMDLALACLTAGHYERGWTLYETRISRELKTQGLNPGHRPQWHGEKFDGTLLVMREAGYGDMIQFCRFIPQILDRCDRVVFKVPQALGRLMRSLHPDIEIDDGPKDVFSAYHRWTFLMSLPHILGLERGGIYAPQRYLSAPDQAFIENGLIWLGNRAPRIGLIWGGSPMQPRDHIRSIPRPFVRKLIETTGYEWHILQQGPHLKDLGSVGGLTNVVLHDEVKDFSHTAALMQSMDVVLSVCTSTAHLAGALGVPVWAMLATTPDFRWPYRLETSPWYPSARIFRQAKPQDWNGVVDRVLNALENREYADHSN